MKTDTVDWKIERVSRSLRYFRHDDYPAWKILAVNYQGVPATFCALERVDTVYRRDIADSVGTSVSRNRASFDFLRDAIRYIERCAKL